MRPFPMHRLLRALLCVVMAGWVGLRVAALEPATGLDKYARQAWSTENGLPQNSVHAMLQTRDGYFWMATEGGLARFNGYEFRVFDRSSTPRLAGNDIRCLLEDGAHALWVGTSSGLTRLKDGTAQTFAIADGLPSDTVTGLLQTADGTLWVLTTRGLASVALENGPGQTRLHFQAAPQAIGDGVHAMVPSGGDSVWAATDTGLYRVHGASVQRASQTGTPVDALSIDASGSLVYASNDGIFELRDGTLKTLVRRDAMPSGGVRSLLITQDGVWATGKGSVLLIQPTGVVTFQAGRALPGDQVETIFADRRGAVWIGTNKGVARWWKGHMEASRDQGAAAVLAMYEDRDGDLWMGTETAGALELRDRAFSMIGSAQGLGEGAATSVAEGLDGDLWIGTNGGGVSHVSGSTFLLRTYSAKDGLASNTVLALAGGGKTTSDLWVGTPDGLSHFQANRIRTYGPADGLADDFVRSLLVAHDSGLWVGTRHGVTRWQDGRSTTWTTAQGLGSNLVGAMAEDAAQDLWVGTLGGLSRIRGGAVTNYTTAEGLPDDTVTALAADTGGSLWVGTRGHGLAVRAGDHFFSYAGVPDLPRTIFAILEDQLGFLWLSSEHGLDRIGLDDLAAFHAGKAHSVSVTHYGTADGLGSAEGSDAGHPSALRLRDGRLCFATRRGIVIVDPALLPSMHLAPPVMVEGITADDREVSRSELASLAPGPSHFSFTFAGINLASPNRLQYRYMLEGFDRDWVQAGTRRSAFYTNIPPGHYRFRVSARFGSEPWHEGDSAVVMGLRPRFTQTNWFLLLLLCLLAGFLLGLYRLRMRALKTRFDAVAGERNRIAREIHDTLAQGFVAVSVRLEILSQILHGNRLDECRQQLNETRALVLESLGEARRSIWNLRTEGADAQTLPARLARIVQSVIAGGVDSQIETTGVYRALSPGVEDELYRIAQEAAANALRHAMADEIGVRLAYSQDMVELEITDDGHGFDVTAAPSPDEGHFGLTGLRERAQQIGATLILNSTPGIGTSVRVHMPVSRDERKE